MSSGAPDTPPELPSASTTPRPDRYPAGQPAGSASLWQGLAARRKTTVAVLAAGAAVFTVASLASPGRTVHTASARHGGGAGATGTSQRVGALPAGAGTSSGTVSAVASAAARTSSTSTTAPVDHGAISALAANGIPRVALNAYRVAAARMADAEPSCGIDWSLLAGIGRVESDHGQFAGSVLHTDGTSTPRIIGPALDGVKWDRILAPADGLALDGDAKFAHALGPMQFIPSTWDTYGADATGDGRADIFNINDAALSAAHYLCAAGGNLRTTAGKTRAVLAYNHNTSYLAEVLALANAYHHGIRITGIPVGITKGKLPSVPHGRSVPAANPGGALGGGSAADTTRPATHHSGGTSAHGTTGSTGSTNKHPAPSTSKSHSSSSKPTGKPTTSKPTTCSTTSTPPGTPSTSPTPTPTTTSPTGTSTPTCPGKPTTSKPTGPTTSPHAAHAAEAQSSS